VKADSDKLMEHQRQRLVWESITPEDLASALKWTPEAVEKAITAGEVIYFEWGGRHLLPRWQLFDDPANGLLPELRVLQHAFAQDVVALNDWITTPNAKFDSRTPREALIAGDVDRVLDSIATIGASV
jgi:hypothetical protein